jgi:large conductance mechanosensitive channel
MRTKARCGVLDEFKKFLLRGNVVDLAVGVAVGAAFTAVVNSMVKDLITPLIAAVGGKPNFAGLSFTLHGSTFNYGEFINALVSFLIMASVIFFFVVQPLNHLVRLTNRNEKTEDSKSAEEKLLEEIRDLLKDGKEGKKRS